MRHPVRNGQAARISGPGPGFWYLILAIFLSAFALRVYQLDAQSIWWDEGHSIQMASAPLAQIPTLPGMDVHPPGYFALLHQWMALGGRSEFALRYLSVVFSMLTVALLMRFGWELVGRRLDRIGTEAIAITGGLAALSPLYVTYAQEVRMYAVVTFFALASVYFQWRIVVDWKAGRLNDWKAGELANQPPREHGRFWLIIGYVLATVASLYIHYFTIFLLLFENVVWLVWALVPRRGAGPRRERVVVWLGTQLIIVFLFSLQLPVALRQTVAYANPNLNPPGVGDFFSRSWAAYTVGTAVGPVASGWLAWALAAILSLIVLFQIVRSWRRGGVDELGTVALLLGWLLIPLAVYFLVLQRRPSFEPRYMMLVTPALVLLLAWGLTGVLVGGDGTGRRWTWWGVLGLVVILIAFGLGTWSHFTNVEDYKDDSAGVAAWLGVETTSGDVVYVDVPHPFHYYVERIPAPTRYLFVDVHTAADILNAEAVGRNRLFWVTWWGSDTDPRGVIPFLLDKAGLRAGELDFRGYHVTWWDLQDNAQFSLPDDLPSLGGCSPGGINFGDVVTLNGLAFSEAVQAGGEVWVTLHFNLLGDTDADYRASLRLLSPEKDMLSPTDKDLLNDRHFRTSAWPVDDPQLNQAINVYTLPIPPGTEPGDYRLEAVIYDSATMEALPVAGDPASGCNSPAGGGNSAWLGTVAISP
jgi:mannosyltransferase